MPIITRYPGVYVQEIPSGVHPIAGVSTSNTAFVDFFARGPVNVAVQITSLGDFRRIFGGLDTRSEASYAIQQFYLNGGNLAWVVRIAGDMKTAQCILQGGSPLQNTLIVNAASPGSWASNLLSWIEVAVDTNRTVPAGTSFNFVAREVKMVNGKRQIVSTEVYRNLTMDINSPRYAKNVVNDASLLVQLDTDGLGEIPTPTGSDVVSAPQDNNFVMLQGGTDGNELDNSGTIQDAPVFSKALIGDPDQKTGMYALDRIAPFIFNLLCLPAAAKFYALDRAHTTQNYATVYAQALSYCYSKRAFLLVDIPPEIDTLAHMLDENAFLGVIDGLRAGDEGANAAVYFPRLLMPDPLNENRLRNVGASGTLAGLYARTDTSRGVWKAAAGTAAGLVNASMPLKLTDDENGFLNPLGLNAQRNFPIFGNVSWGARTLLGADQQASEWKYIPIRRTALYIEESLYEGLKWAVFEPNDEPLWAQIERSVGGFLQTMFRQGAFQGQTRQEAYLVKCDHETTTQVDIDNGVVNIVVGFAPLKPAEFVVIQLEQLVGQTQA